MNYIHNKFIKPIVSGDVSLQIIDINGVIRHTINPYSVLHTQIVNNLLKISIKGNKHILLNFSSNYESQLSLKYFQEKLDILRNRTPLLIDKQILNYVENVVSGLTVSNGSTASVEPTLSLIGLSYSQFVSKINSSELDFGNYYKILDFRTCYDQPNFNSNGNPITDNTYRFCDIDPIIVMATSNNTVSETAYQPSYPNDILKYDWTWNTTEVSGGTAYGRISERIDEYGNRTDYDHRNILFKRYTTYFYNTNSPLSGTISISATAVSGVGTNFTNLSVNNVIYTSYFNNKFYKITEIIDDTNMFINGIELISLSELKYYQATKEIDHDNEIYRIFYLNDVGTNDINDGGNDVYDGANRIYTSISGEGYIPYTHTQMSTVDDEATFEDYIMDGSILTGASSSYFGPSSSYFTNMYPGLFVLSAYNINIDSFRIDGNIGADGSGQASILSFTSSGYSIFVKQVFNGYGDPSINHIIITDCSISDVTHLFDEETQNDYDEVLGISSSNQIHYLSMYVANSEKIRINDLHRIINEYISLIGNDINQTLDNLNSNYNDIISVLPGQEVLYVSTFYKSNNIVDSESRDVLTFKNTLLYNVNNYIGDTFKYNGEEGSIFKLSNNVFLDGIYTNNRFDDLCCNNTFTGGGSSNVIGNFFQNNRITNDFFSNRILDVFTDNTIFANFSNNKIDTRFYNNHIESNNFEQNTIGFNFGSNRIQSSFTNNTIGIDFYDNRINASFYDNLIGKEFNSQIFNSDTINIARNLPGIIPMGGTAGYFLSKTSNNNYDTEWVPKVEDYLHYNCIIYQNNTNPAYPSILGVNTLGDISWSRVDVGVYRGYLENAFDINRTSILYNSVTNNYNYISIVILDANTIELTQRNLELVLVDGIDYLPIEIKTYFSNQLND